MYPDIKWTLYVEINNSHNDWIHKRSVSTPSKNTELDAYKAKIRKLHAPEDQGKTGSELEFGLEADYDDENVKNVSAISSGFKETILTLYRDFNELYSLLCQKSYLDNTGKTKESAPQIQTSHEPTLGGANCYLEITPPSLRLGGSWQYAINPQTYQSTWQGTLSLSADPLISAKGGIDLLNCLAYVPGAGEFIIALLAANKLITYGVKVVSAGNIDVEISFYFNLYLKGEISMEGDLSLPSMDTKSQISGDVKLNITLELGLRVDVHVKRLIFFVKDVDATAEAKGEVECCFLHGSAHWGTENGSPPTLGLDLFYPRLTLMVKGDITLQEGKNKKRGKQKDFSVQKSLSFGGKKMAKKGEEESKNYTYTFGG